MEELSNNFKIINSKKDYQKKRLQLADSMIASLCYDKNDENSNEILDFLGGIHENFSKKIEIVLLEKNSLDENFRKDIFSQETPYFQICEPHLVDPLVVSLKNFDQFDLYKYFEEKANFFEKDFPVLKKNVFERISRLLDSFPIVIFIKGTPFKPFCKFSKQLMELIRPLKIRYKSFDIFADDNLRTFLRLYSGWKTYPQIYIKGKILGGGDVLKELIEKNEINHIIPNECKYEEVVKSIKNTINKEIIIFGRGKKENIECEKTSEALKIINDFNIKYNYFDILKDEMIAEIILQINHEPFPHIFVYGKFLNLHNLIEIYQNNRFYFQFPITINEKFNNFSNLFEENTILLILLNEQFDFGELVNKIQQENNGLKIVIYKKSANPNLVNYLQKDLKIIADDFIIIKNLRILSIK